MNRTVLKGFTLIELMIVVAIVAVLAAVAIPAYQGYIRRSYTGEVASSFSAIKSAEESYFAINNCYVLAPATPTSIPSGTSTVWPNGTYGYGTGGWASCALGVRPDRTVRYQYQIYAGNDVDAAGGCGSSSSRPSGIDCVSTSALSDTGSLIPSSVFGSNWYVIVARGDLDGDNTNSTFLTTVDNSKIITCNELE